MTRALMCHRLIGNRSRRALIISALVDMVVDTGVIGILGVGGHYLSLKDLPLRCNLEHWIPSTIDFEPGVA